MKPKKTAAHWPKVRIISEDETSRITRVSLSLTDAWYEVEVYGVPMGGQYTTQVEAERARDEAVYEVLRKAA